MYIVIETTTDNEKIAQNISKNIIDKNLSPCISIKQIYSIYKWDKKTKGNKEYKISIKTFKSLENEISNIINLIHNYDTPEIISYNINILNQKYKKWFMDNIKL